VSGERKYFSHRIDHGLTGRMMSVVGIAETP
jgi:copper oxidase (laccase) domain-containing protein